VDETRRRMILALGISPFALRSMGGLAFDSPEARLLAEPFLQFPDAHSVSVVWFTEFEARRSGVQVSHEATSQIENICGSHETWTFHPALSKRIAGLAEDAGSLVPKPPSRAKERVVWRHEARVPLPTSHRPWRYRVSNSPKKKTRSPKVWSEVYEVMPFARRNGTVRLLLTSDHQLKANAPRCMEIVAAREMGRPTTEGEAGLHGILFAGDLVNVPDRASEWFDASNGCGFFPGLQGTAEFPQGSGRRSGGALAQRLPLYPCVGNHEVMGAWAPGDAKINFDGTVPLSVREDGWNTRAYESIFSLPQQGSDSYAGGRSYAVTMGNCRVVTLFLTRVWRPEDVSAAERDPARPETWGHGRHLFDSLEPGGAQWQWLKAQLESPEWTRAPYRIVMLHHPVHSVGHDGVMAFCEPQATVERDEKGDVTRVAYSYPDENDQLTTVLAPLLEAAGVSLVFYGHNHLYQHFKVGGVHYLETSNVGNTYGIRENSGDNAWTTSPASPLLADATKTAYSVFDSADGSVTTWEFDATNLEDAGRLHDKFTVPRFE
jgi:hypothetical protein